MKWQLNRIGGTQSLFQLCRLTALNGKARRRKCIYVVCFAKSALNLMPNSNNSDKIMKFCLMMMSSCRSFATNKATTSTAKTTRNGDPSINQVYCWAHSEFFFYLFFRFTWPFYPSLDRTLMHTHSTLTHTHTIQAHCANTRWKAMMLSLRWRNQA